MIKKIPSASDQRAEKSAITSTIPASFEDAMAELATLVERMEAGELPLEASVAAYARGSELVQYCAKQLEKVEQQVSILDGELLKPFQTDSTDAGN